MNLKNQNDFMERIKYSKSEKLFMKKWIKILFWILLAIVMIIILYSVGRALLKPTCGTPLEIRDKETGKCEIYVGCSLPKGISEDATCRDELSQQIDGVNDTNLLRICPDRIIIDGSICVTTNNRSCPPKFDTEFKINDQIVNKSKYDTEWVDNNCKDRRVYMD